MVVGRDDEQASLRRALAAAGRGQGRAVVLLGEPGIGKTALLDAISREVEGFRLVRTQGRETETELPFSGLADILRPFADGIAGLSDSQAAALRSALALGAPVEAERFAVCAATLSLLAWGTEATPLLVLVDDAHWLDAASLEALLFSAHRLRSEPVAFLFASRLDDARFAGLGRIELAGLAPAAAATVLAASGVQIAPSVVDGLVEATDGNPLALLELPQLLTAAQRTGAEPLDDPLPIGPALGRAFVRRAAELPASSRRALLVAAAEGDDALARIAAALNALGLPIASLDAAVEADLLAVDDGSFRFRHPLVRAAVYRHATAAERREAHATLAATSEGWQRAWHLAACATGPDESVAAELEDVAKEARARSGYAAAARALERAAQLSPDSDARARRLVAAATDHQLAAGDARALELLDVVLTSTDDPVLCADARHLAARIRLSRSPTSQDIVQLLEAAKQIEPIDPQRAALMYLDAAMKSVSAETSKEAQTAAFHALWDARARGGGLGEELDLLLGDWTELAPDGVPGITPRWDALLPKTDDLAYADRMIVVAAGASSVGQEYERARDLLVRISDTARRASAGALLAQALCQLALLDYRTSRWRIAASEAEEAYSLAEATGRPLECVRALSYLARIEAAQGREQECRAHAARAWQLAAPIGLASLPDWHANVALGVLELGLGHPEEAIERLEIPCGDIDRGGLSPGIFRAAGDLIDAYVRAGLRRKATRTLDEFERRAAEADRTWALAVSARCRGQLAAESDFAPCFERAIRLHARSPVPFDRARTHLCYGERLRRSHRRVEARRQLRTAREQFDRIGATLWARRAEAELAASGEHLRRRNGAPGEELTPQELQLARIVASGATNREAAAALFVSPKTVEAHLGTIYRKLGLRSRTELAARLAMHP